MNSQAIQSLYAYHSWANERLLATAMQITLAQFIEPSTAYFGPVRTVLVHLVNVERNWVARVQQQPLSWDAPERFTAVAALYEHWRAINTATMAYIQTLDDEALAQVIHYFNLRGEPNAYPVWQMLLHQANHATQHRSEVALVLAGWGFSTGDLDYLRYLDATGQNLGAVGQ